ncbi:hypothetical protein MKW92_043314 [Papaver armeniacum]|nr:hypothetical protein MKW92_043314 [Papaver armeniacum]
MASSSIFSIFIFLLFLMLHVCEAQESSRERYEKCKRNFACGNGVNVGFPFWGDHHNGDADPRPEYCGLPGYKLDCYDGYTAEIIISEETYRVLEINSQSQVMIIVNKDFLDDDDDDACPAKYPIPNFNSTLFNYSLDVGLLSLYFDCADIGSLDQYKFNCQLNHTGASSDAYWYVGIPAQFSSSCRKYVSVPVMRAALGDLTTEKIPAVIKQGFSASYLSSVYVNTIDLCENCKSYGGACGYNTTSRIPVCFSGTFIFLC